MDIRLGGRWGPGLSDSAWLLLRSAFKRHCISAVTARRKSDVADLRELAEIDPRWSSTGFGFGSMLQRGRILRALWALRMHCPGIA